MHATHQQVCKPSVKYDHNSLSSAEIQEGKMFRDPFAISQELQDNVDVPSWWQAGVGLLRRLLPCDDRCRMHATHQQVRKPFVKYDHNSLSSAETQEGKMFRDPFAISQELQGDVDVPSWWHAGEGLPRRLLPCNEHCRCYATHQQVCKPSLLQPITEVRLRKRKFSGIHLQYHKSFRIMWMCPAGGRLGEDFSEGCSPVMIVVTCMQRISRFASLL